MTELEWTKELSIRLLQEYEKRPELWDPTHDYYRVPTLKYESWCEMAVLFECDITDLRKKLTSLFASHRREKQKVRAGRRSTWFLYSYMSFLPSHLHQPPVKDKHSGEEEEASAAPRKKLKSRHVRPYVGSDGSGLEEEGGTGSEEEEGEEAPPSPMEIKIEQDAVPPLTVPRSQRHASTIKLRRPLRRRRVLHAGTQPAPAHHRVTDAAQLVRRAPPPQRKKDECDSFGEYIASSLRKHDERTQSMIKQAINNILFEQEMKRYNTSHYVLIDAAEENPLVDGDHHATTTTDM